MRYRVRPCGRILGVGPIVEARMDGERVLTVDEVAERLRVTTEAVRRWLRSGKLKGVRIGSTKAGWRIPESEVRRLLGGA